MALRTVENAGLLAVTMSDPSRLLLLAAGAAVVFFLTALLQWISPGGPAWGKHRLMLASTKKGCTTIPGPRGLPFVGSMGLMHGLAHRKLAATAAKMNAKRLMAFSIGETRAVVTAHPDVAREILGSPFFADRPIKESAHGLLFHRAMGFAPYGAYWRALRRISSAHLFSPKQIANAAASRAAIAVELVWAIGAAGEQRLVVTPREFLKRAALNNMMATIFGKKYDVAASPETETPEAKELAHLVQEGYDVLGMLNWSDHLPFLASLDLQSIRSRCSELVPRVDRFVRKIIGDHRAAMKDGAAAVDFVDVLLSLSEGERLSDDDMVAVLWEMIFRGTDTVAIVMEWALARLLRHPDVQLRVHDELDRVVGPNDSVKEQHTCELHYLQAVIKETLRVHPPGPLLSWARLATSDVRVDGHVIPAGTTAVVNMWAITHDPDFWPDPDQFRPSRFMQTGTETGSADPFPIFGSDLRLAPFGSGRRVCPGKPLAMTTVTFWMATLLHEFKWTPATATGVEMREALRLSCEMAAALTARVEPRRA